MLLIPNPPHQLESKVDKAQKPYEYIKSSNADDASFARNTLNAFFKNIAVPEQQSLKTRLNNDFDAAYFELLNHQLFYENNFEIKAHPSLPNVGKQPDFLLEKNGESFYLECKLFSNLIDEQPVRQQLKNDVIDQLNQLTSKYYCMVVRILKIKGDLLPDLSDIYQNLQQKLNVKPNTTENESFSSYYENFEYNLPNCDLKIALLIRQDWQEERTSAMLVAAHINHPFPEVNIKSLKSGMIKKLVRYQLTDLPMVLAVNIASPKYCNASIFETLFYGTLIPTAYSNKPIHNSPRINDGLFTKPGNNLDLIAGILLFLEASPFNTDLFNCRYYKNPNFKGVLQSMEVFD